MMEKVTYPRGKIKVTRETWLIYTDWLTNKFLNPDKHWSGYIDIELKDGMPEKLTIRIDKWGEQ